jgi:hypothetical protein
VRLTSAVSRTSLLSRAPLLLPMTPGAQMTAVNDCRKACSWVVQVRRGKSACWQRGTTGLTAH